MSNFAQHVFTVPAAQEPIVITFTNGWDTTKGNADKRFLTRVEFRAILKRPDNPAKVTIKADHPAYADLIAAGSKSAAHVKRFEDMAAKAALAKQGLALMKTIKGLLGE